MNSSSRLFPVSLMNADFAGTLHEDVYQLNPGISADRSLRISITRVTDPSRNNSRPAVILLHGEFNNRRQWFTPEGHGFAAELARAGFDVWLPEARGHGLSPEHDHWADNRLSVSALEDWPAVQAFVAEQSGSSPFWVAQGLGGLGLAYALTQNVDMAQAAAGAVLVDIATAHWHHNLRQLNLKQRWRVKRLGYADGLGLNWGPEREPWSLFSELNQWAHLAKKSRHPVHDRLESLQLPLLLLGVRDRERDLWNLHSRSNSAEAVMLGDNTASADGIWVVPDQVLNEVRRWLQDNGGRRAPASKVRVSSTAV